MLEHGESIIQALPVNPGLLSEQGSESNNRWWRHFREFHSRQFSIGTSLRDAFVRKTEMADPEILGINTKYVSGEKRRRVRKKVAKIPLPEPVIALLKDDAKEKYMASFAPMEVDEDLTSASQPQSSDLPPTPDEDSQPGPSDAQPHDLPSSAEIEEEEEEEISLDDPEQLQQYVDDLVVVHPDSDQEMDTSLGVLALTKKSKSARKKVEKIRVPLDDSDTEMELN